MGTRQFVTFCAAMAFILTSGTAQARGGFLLGFDLGGATVSGDQNVQFVAGDGYGSQCSNPSGINVDVCNDVARTDAGSGVAFGLRIGYNVLGFGGLEAHLWGSGNLSSGGDKPEGAVYGTLVARYFPLQHVKKWFHRKFDPSIYVGWQPMAYMGYHLKSIQSGYIVYNGDNEGRGWTSRTGWQFGVACDYELKKGVLIGLDLRFHKPSYDRFYHSWDDNTKFEPESEPSTLVFAPMLRLTFHFVDPDPDGKIVGAHSRGATNSSQPKSGTGDDHYEW
jgi:hypothetical protein